VAPFSPPRQPESPTAVLPTRPPPVPFLSRSFRPAVCSKRNSRFPVFRTPRSAAAFPGTEFPLFVLLVILPKSEEPPRDAPARMGPLAISPTQFDFFSCVGMLFFILSFVFETTLSFPFHLQFCYRRPRGPSLLSQAIGLRVVSFLHKGLYSCPFSLAPDPLLPGTQLTTRIVCGPR